MKGKAAFAGIIAMLAAGGIFLMNKNDRDGTSVLRVAFPYSKASSAFEPARIHLAPEYIFLENIYSPLVEVSPKTGAIEAGVAESFRWEGTSLHLAIRKDLKTVSGRRITADDAAFSLKRLLVMPGNTHGDFSELICGKQKVQSVEENCDGIHVEGDELILSTTGAGKTFLLPMLAAIDFAIIPKSSVDPETLKIVDFENTSGPYYVSKDDPQGRIEWKANPHHYHYSKSIPQEVHLVPTDPKNPHGSLTDFEEGRVDYITTIDAARADDVIAFSRTVKNSVLHTSMNIRSFVVMFSERAREELSSEERFAVGKALRQAILPVFNGVNGYEASRQFLPAFGEGALTAEAVERIEEKFSRAGTPPTKPLKFALLRLGDNAKFISVIKQAIPSAEIMDVPNSPDFSKYASKTDMPHILVAGPDTGFLEDIGLISYSLNAGYFGMTKAERTAWLRNYMSLRDKDSRLRLLRAIHEKALSEPVTVPLLVAPYAALARAPWRIGLSQLYANNPIWLLHKD